MKPNRCALSFVLLLPLVLLAAGCGSKKETSSTPVQVLPAARTAGEWAGRIVNRFIRPTNSDIQALLALNNPQTKIYLQERNPNTIAVIDKRMNDLGRCSDRLATIGPPPQTAVHKQQLNQVDTALQRACRHYAKVSRIVLDAVRLLSSDNSDDHLRGLKKLPEAIPDARAGSLAYDQGVMIAQRLPEFRRHGLKPAA
jgi:hypothetical protein